MFQHINYQDYLDEQEEKRNAAKIAQQAPKIEKVEAKAAAMEAPKTVTKRKLSFKEQHELDTLNKEIPDLEAKKLEISSKLSAGSNNHEELMQWSREVEELNALLDEKGMRWLELSE